MKSRVRIFQSTFSVIFFKITCWELNGKTVVSSCLLNILLWQFSIDPPSICNQQKPTLTWVLRCLWYWCCAVCSIQRQSATCRRCSCLFLYVCFYHSYLYPVWVPVFSVVGAHWCSSPWINRLTGSRSGCHLYLIVSLVCGKLKYTRNSESCMWQTEIYR